MVDEERVAAVRAGAAALRLEHRPHRAEQAVVALQVNSVPLSRLFTTYTSNWCPRMRVYYEGHIYFLNRKQHNYVHLHA